MRTGRTCGGGGGHGSCACAILSPFPPVDSCYSVWPNAVISRFIYSVSTSVIFMKVIHINKVTIAVLVEIICCDKVWNKIYNEDFKGHFERTS